MNSEITEKMKNEDLKLSPKWSNTTKLVVALTLVTFMMGLLISFHNIVMPIILAILLAYLLHPVVGLISKKYRISWRLSALLIYLVLLIVVVGLLTWGGIAIIDQFQNLLGFLQRSFENLPLMLENLSHQEIRIGYFAFDFSTLEIDSLADQALSSVSPLLSRTGSIVGNIASGAVYTIGLTLFIILISQFILSGTEGGIRSLLQLDIPGYTQDLDRFAEELRRIWRAFLRGQLLIMSVTFVIYLIVLNALQINFPVGLALIASIARLLPYIGPAIAWTTYGLVAIFQADTPFNLPPWGYAALIVGIGIAIDMFMDNVIVPKVYSDVLKLHPALILIGAIVAASWLGLIGALLAAPVVATTVLMVRYAIRKLFDMDPWQNIAHEPHEPALVPPVRKLENIQQKIMVWIKKKI